MDVFLSDILTQSRPLIWRSKAAVSPQNSAYLLSKCIVSGQPIRKIYTRKPGITRKIASDLEGITGCQAQGYSRHTNCIR